MLTADMQRIVEQQRSSSDAPSPHGFDSCSRTRGLKNDPGMAIGLTPSCLRMAMVVVNTHRPAGFQAYNALTALALGVDRVEPSSGRTSKDGQPTQDNEECRALRAQILRRAHDGLDRSALPLLPSAAVAARVALYGDGDGGGGTARASRTFARLRR